MPATRYPPSHQAITRRACCHLHLIALLFTCMFYLPQVNAGEQQYQELANNVRSVMKHGMHFNAQSRNSFTNLGEALDWLSAMKKRMKKWEPKIGQTLRFLQLVHYEAKRAGLDPQLVLAIIEVESNFNRFAVSSAGARGLMQVMPFWLKLIGEPSHNLMDIETNIRYGCTILRYYLDIENGNLFRALGRYNGSLGYSKYPYKVLRAMKKNWKYQQPSAALVARDPKPAAFVKESKR